MFDNYDDNNIFAKIIRKEAPAISVYEDESTLAFMDIMPQKDGHILIVPKEKAITLFELSENSLLACMRTAQLVGRALKAAMGTEGITMFQQSGADSGQTVPHVHFHLLPGSLQGAKGHAAEFADQDALREIAAKIMAELAV